MTIDPQFPWWALADAIGGVLAITICAAFTPVIRFIVRRLTARLPKSPEAERANEELEGMAVEMGAGERIELAASLFLNIKRLQDEIAERKEGKPNVKNAEAVKVISEFFQFCAVLRSTLEISRAGARGVFSSLGDFEWDRVELDSVDAAYLGAKVIRLIDSRSRWISKISKTLKTNSRVALLSLLTVNLPAFLKTTKERRGLKRLLSQEAILDRELRRLLKDVEEASERPTAKRS